MNSTAELPRRPYRHGARDEAAQATAERILDAYLARAEVAWFEDIRLDDIAADAGVTVQTVIRRFGGKEGLLEAAHDRLGDTIHAFRETRPGDIDHCVDLVVADYEAFTDAIRDGRIAATGRGRCLAAPSCCWCRWR